MTPEDNREFKIKRGETGARLWATLKDDENDLIDLSIGGTWTVNIAVTVRGGSTNLLDADTMVIPSQLSYPGKVYYDFTEDDADANLPDDGKYDLEITATEPTGRVHKFPKDNGSVFGTVYMMPSKE